MDNLREQLASILRPHADFAVLFGSYASGRANSQSDIDVAFLPSVPRLSWTAQVDLVRELSLAIGDRQVDLIDLNHADPIIAYQILKTGMLIDAKSKLRWHEFRLRTLREYEDFRRERAAGEARLLAVDATRP